jgi:hypothetical protein
VRLGLPLVLAILAIGALVRLSASLTGAALLVLPLVVAEGVRAWRWLQAIRSNQRQAPSSSGSPVTRAFHEAEAHDLETELARDVIQQWTRRQTSHGEVLEGTMRTTLLKGARVTSLHVSICPAFAAHPSVAAEVIDGPAASVKVAEAFSFGVRLEVRLDEPAADACNVMVGIVVLERGER